MRSIVLTFALTLTLVLAAPPAFAQGPKGNAPKDGTSKEATPTGSTTPDAKRLAAPKGVTAVQMDPETVRITFERSKEAVAGYRIYVSQGSGGPRLLRVVGDVAGSLVVRLQEIAAALAQPVTNLIGRLVGFTVEAYDAKGLVSPKASSKAITLKGPNATPADPGGSTTPTDPGGSTTTPGTTSGAPVSSGSKDANTGAKAWAAQTARTEVTLAWTPAKSATSQRVTFEFGGRTFVLGTFSPGVTRAVFTLQRLAQVSGQRLDAIRVSPLVFHIESLVQQRVAGIFDFNRVMPVSPEKGLASKQAPAAVKAEQTGEGEITLTWQAHPDAVAYAIGRARGNEGFRTICALCPTGETRFVDGEALPGVRHVYTVQAVTVDGPGARATSNVVGDPAAGAGAKQ